jgi:hypothetical protein
MASVFDPAAFQFDAFKIDPVDYGAANPNAAGAIVGAILTRSLARLA